MCMSGEISNLIRALNICTNSFISLYMQYTSCLKYLDFFLPQLADEDECSPLYYAVMNENSNLVEYLLQMVMRKRS